MTEIVREFDNHLEGYDRTTEQWRAEFESAAEARDHFLEEERGARETRMKLAAWAGGVGAAAGPLLVLVVGMADQEVANTLRSNVENVRDAAEIAAGAIATGALTASVSTFIGYTKFKLNGLRERLAEAQQETDKMHRKTRSREKFRDEMAEKMEGSLERHLVREGRKSYKEIQKAREQEFAERFAERQKEKSRFFGGQQ